MGKDLKYLIIDLFSACKDIKYPLIDIYYPKKHQNS